MCGIVGFHHRRPDFHPHSALQVALEGLEHRGPDDSRRSVQPGEHGRDGLGHRRLSIRDLTRTARQLFASEDEQATDHE